MIDYKKIRQLKKRYKRYRRLGKKYRINPVEPWAFIRVKNEIKTLKACLESIKPVIKKGVIAYHKLSENEFDDGTESYITEFCKKNPGFILYKYDYEVIPANDIRYKALEKIPIENRLDSYYNAVLSKIPVGEWFIKIDCDHIYDTQKLRECLYLPKKDEDIISIGRFNLHYEKNKLYVRKEHTFYDIGDHWLLKNQEIYFKFSSGYENGNFYAWEECVIPKERKIYNTGIFNWHFPFMKERRKSSEDDLMEFENYKITLYDKLYYHLSKDIIDKQRIYKICKELF